MSLLDEPEIIDKRFQDYHLAGVIERMRCGITTTVFKGFKESMPSTNDFNHGDIIVVNGDTFAKVYSEWIKLY